MRPAHCGIGDGSVIPTRLTHYLRGGNVEVVTITNAPTKAARPRARVTSQGQITIPKAVRDAMDLTPGDEVEFDVGPEVVVRRHRRPGILDFAGIASEAAERLPRTAADLDDLIAEARGKKARRG